MTPQESSASNSRLRLTSNPRWIAAVLFSLALGGAVEVVGVPPAFVAATALTVPVVGMADLVVGIMLARRALIAAGLEAHLHAERGLRALDQLEEPTHGHLSIAAEALGAGRERMRSLGDPSGGLRVVTAAIAVVDELEDSIRASGPARALRRGRGRWWAVGGLAAKNSYHADDDPMLLYQDPLNLPVWIRSPRVRDALVRLGAVLDDVRLLHDARIEWSVLLFTMWARLVLVCSSPSLAAATLGRAPLTGGLGGKDVPWACALALSSVTALAAPWTARTVMRRDRDGASLRRALLIVEVPIAVAAMVATPCWAVASFAAGWTNWWQRPTFSWAKLVVWMLAMEASLAFGMNLIGASADQITFEILISTAVVAVIGSSQGAMFPVSATMLAEVILRGLASPRSARRRANEQISTAILHLLAAADAIEACSPSQDGAAAAEVSSLRRVAAALAARADHDDHWAGRVPLGISRLLDAALQRAGGPSSVLPPAAYEATGAAPAGHGEPLTTLSPSYYSASLSSLRLKNRGHARSLFLLVVKIIEEARRYGTGALQIRCHEDDSRLVLRFANRVRPGPLRSGRGTGEATLRKLAAEIPGCGIDRRGLVDGTFIDLPEPAQRFGVQISLPIDLFAKTDISRRIVR